MNHLKRKDCIDLCNDCPTECETCATACISMPDTSLLAQCIAFDRYCADMCRMAAAFIARSDQHTFSIVKKFCTLCAEMCNDCAMECEKHVHMEHCKRCAEACRACATACNQMIKMEILSN